MIKRGMLLLFLAVFALTACSDDDGETPTHDHEEGQFVRVLVSDQDQANYYVVNPHEGTVETVAGQYAAGRLYTSPSGRYVSVINTDDNLATFFDSGIEAHGDHAHVKGTPKWALSKATASRPVHYYGKGDNILVFNDGEGSISHFKESTMHTEAEARVFDIGDAHHGAPALFNNGTIAVTEKDGSTAWTLPERVKVIDMNGNTLHESTIQTSGIHGEAGNGETVLFGSVEGILRVNQDGSQLLIENPESFGDEWIGTIIYGEESETFIGFDGGRGVYEIDIATNSINTIEENANLSAATFDWEGHHLILVYTDGTVKVLDGHGFGTIASEQLEINFPAEGSKGAPTYAASEEFLYISDGINGSIAMYELETLEFVGTLALPGKPARMALMGSLAHDDHEH
ncbi:hypothetical protein [Roseivirga pacifica]